MQRSDFNSTQEKLFDKLFDLWENSENKSVQTKKFYDYWDGKLSDPSGTFTDQTKTACNVVKQIVEAKLTNMLDAKFDIEVVPVLNSFSSPSAITEMKDVADILNDEVHNVLNFNRWDSKKEKIGRWGLIAGYGSAQTMWSTEDVVEGEIKIIDVEPVNLRWNKKAKKFEDLSFLAYEVEMNIYAAKKMYASDSKGNWDVEMCEKIDELAEVQASNIKGQKKGVVNIESSETANQAWAYDSEGITAGKTINLIVMFLLDDTVYAPEKSDSSEEAAEKQTYQKKYPNGRMLVFSSKKEKKVILDDKPAPAGFMHLGNVDVFNPIDFESIAGKGEVEDLVGIQDRINGALLKARQSIANYVKSVGLDSDLDAQISEGALVNHPALFLTGLGRDKKNTPGVITNDLLADLTILWQHIDSLKQEAYAIARVNETMLNGIQQKGTDSADQVEALQESPMSAIRAIQRNFKDFVIRIGEKIVTLIQENYTVQRLVKLSSGILVNDGGKNVVSNTARFTPVQGDDGEQQITIELLNSVGKAVKTLKFNKDWKFRVDVTSGTEIPRSRRETAALVDRLYTNGMLGNAQDPDVIEQYCKSIDLPNYRAFISLLKRKQQIAASTPPTMPKIEAIMTNPDMAKSFAEILKACEGYGKSKELLLEGVGLIGKPDTLDEAPVQSMTSRSDVKDIAILHPDKISADPQVQQNANSQAQGIEVMKKLPSTGGAL